MNQLKPIKKSNLLLLAVLLFLAGFLVTIMISRPEPNNPSTVALDYLKSLQSGDCRVLYDENSSQQIKNSIKRDDWMNNCQFLSQILTEEPEQLSIATLGPNRKEVVFRVSSSIKVNYRVAVGLILTDDGKWLMTSFSSQAEPEPEITESD